MVLSVVEQKWPEIVGKLLASRSRPRAFENGVLLVSADSQAVVSDINFKSSSIKREIEKKALLKLNGIRAETGRYSKPAPAKTAQARKAQDRSQSIGSDAQDELKGKIMEKYRGIDQDLALCIARCRIMSLSSTKISN